MVLLLSGGADRVKRIVLCVVLLLGSSPGYCQAPAPGPPPTPVLTISGPTSIVEGTLAVLTVSGGTSNPSSVAWLTMPDMSQYQAGPTLVLTGSPGSYTIVAFAVSG